jgi:molybdopterin/thiamine biosynthesis adenylyltransferase
MPPPPSIRVPGLVPADPWRWKPVLFVPAVDGDRAALAALVRSGAVHELCDTLPDQLVELVTSREPALARDPDARRSAVVDQLDGTDLRHYGTWAWYPWSGRLVHVLPREEFRLVRTDRNRNKIDRPEQRRLLTRRIGVVGLSVGSSAAVTLAQEGVGGAFKLADFDSLGLSNLNRLRAGVHDLGVNKAVLAAREMLEIDPYLDIEVFPHGLTSQNLSAFFDGMDLLVEECDTPWIKLAARETARERGIPVVMDCNDRGLLDIERFDLEPGRPLLHGRLGDVTAAGLGELTPEAKVDLILDMVDRDQISPALSAAIAEIGSTLSSWPQLASGVALGGALVVEAARRILLGRPCGSGRFYADLERLIAPHGTSSSPLVGAAL